MLMRLLRTFLRPYRTWLIAVVVLQLIGTVASLYLPTLNGDIIDKGVVQGNTHYILRLGAIMLLVGLLRLQDCHVLRPGPSGRPVPSGL
jgi:ATP-binding cassette subfamily B multidrug efflux pump